MDIKSWKIARDKKICELGRAFPLISEISDRLGIEEALVRKILKKNNIILNDRKERERREEIKKKKREKARILYRKNKEKRLKLKK